MLARERPRADTRLHVGAKALRRESGEMGGGCNSPRLGRAETESPRKTEEDEEMLLEGEDKPVGETSQRGHKGRCAARKQNKRPIHDRYVVTRTAKDTITGK